MSVRIIITVESEFDADTIQQVLGAAEEDGDIEFSFNFRQVADDPDDKSDLEKLEGVRTELTILLPRLTQQFRSGVETCIRWLKDVEANLKPDR